MKINVLQFCNPLEQFSILSLKSCFTSNFVNIYILHLIILTFFFYFVNMSLIKKNFLFFIFSSLHELVKTSYFKNTKLKKSIYIPIFFYLFLVIFLNNMLGLIPYSYAITSSLIFNFYIIFVVFFHD